MNPILYTNYFIYNLYRYRDDYPATYAATGSAGILALNICTLLALSDFQWGLDLRPHYWSFLVYSVALVVNYFTLYRNSKYLDLFEAMEKADKVRNKWLCAAYLVGSILAFLGAMLWIRYQRFGKL